MEGPEVSRALRDAAAVEPAGVGRFTIELSSIYSVHGHPHGGYLQCVMASAALAAASAQGATHLHPTAVTTNFVGGAAQGPVEIRTDVRRVGRGVSFVHVELHHEGVLTTESLVTLGTLGDASSPRYSDAGVPDVAPLEECQSSGDGDVATISAVLDQRLDPRFASWRDGTVSESGEIRGWLRLDDGDASWDPWSLLFASDAMPPATFALGSSGWVPTLQLTTYLRCIPRGEWLRGRQWCVVIADGLVDERCELFDERGQLVASSYQLAMVRFPAGR